MPAFGLLLAFAAFFRTLRRAWSRPEFRGIVTLTVGVIAVGAWVFKRFEPTVTTWVDALYFTVITLTTVGYGDFAPTTPGTKLFAVLYIFTGLGIIAGFVGVLGNIVLEDSAERTARRNRPNAPPNAPPDPD